MVLARCPYLKRPQQLHDLLRMPPELAGASSEPKIVQGFADIHVGLTLISEFSGLGVAVRFSHPQADNTVASKVSANWRPHAGDGLRWHDFVDVNGPCVGSSHVSSIAEQAHRQLFGFADVSLLGLRPPLCSELTRLAEWRLCLAVPAQESPTEILSRPDFPRTCSPQRCLSACSAPGPAMEMPSVICSKFDSRHDASSSRSRDGADPPG